MIQKEAKGPAASDQPSFRLYRGEAQNSLAQQLEQLTPPLRTLVADLAGVIEVHPEIVDTRVTLTVPGDRELIGTVEMRRESPMSCIAITFEGTIGEHLPTHEGTPYLANWDGRIYRGIPPGDKPFVEDLSKVTKGKEVAWAHVDKNRQWPIINEEDGVIQFVARNDTEVVDTETVLFYIKPSQQ